MSTKATMSSHMESSFNLDHNERKIPVPHSDKKYEEKNNFYYEQNHFVYFFSNTNYIYNYLYYYELN